jgi:ribosomal protein S18 acetylase RimI-like enzyme
MRASESLRAFHGAGGSARRKENGAAQFQRQAGSCDLRRDARAGSHVNSGSNMSIPAFHIRGGNTADAEALAAFAARTFTETFGRDNNLEDLAAHLAAAYGIEQQAHELSDPAWSTLLVHADGHLIAYAQLRRGVMPACIVQPDAVELHRFYVDQPWHGRAVAAALMAAVRDAACALGARHLWLGVWERNPRAIAFYRKSGFVDVGSHHFLVGADRQTDRVLITCLADG